MGKKLVCIMITTFLILRTQAFIIPDEIPSLMSVVYSIIPTMKVGTDSRLAWGFRMGNRADVQILVEIGPQINTQSLGNQRSATTNVKRETPNTLQNLLYAKLQNRKRQVPNGQDGKLIKHLSKNAIKDSHPKKPLLSSPVLLIRRINRKPVVSDDLNSVLKEPYNDNNNKINRTTFESSNTATSAL